MVPQIDTKKRGLEAKYGGKEELRASVFKTYLLRIREEKGAPTLAAVLNFSGAFNAEDERTWLSEKVAARLAAEVERLFGREALLHRNPKYITHPEALGAQVRMLRKAESVADTYLYLTNNDREQTRIGTWTLEKEVNLPPQKRPKKLQFLTLSYTPKADATTESSPALQHFDRHEEQRAELLCAVRQGELASYPVFWGLPEAHIDHVECVAKGYPCCVYKISWQEKTLPPAPLLTTFAGASFFGFLTWLTGTTASGIVGGVAGGALGFLAPDFLMRGRTNEAGRVFEQHRIRALERSLALKGEHGAIQASELSGAILGGKYRIDRKIGAGAFGVVYSARHIELGNEVAIKVLRGAAAKDGSEMARLRREAYVQTHIDSPYVARVHDLDQMPDGSIYVVMDRLFGHSLAGKLKKEGILPSGIGVSIFVDVCRGLEAAHEQLVIHRDLKPGNIFLCDDHFTKLLDFGMSKLEGNESLTQDGFTLGTPEYMSPEQCAGVEVGPRADLYALGVVMYESLTGQLPIHSTVKHELLELHQHVIPRRTVHLRPDLNIPTQLDEAVMMCLNKRAEDRPGSARELADMLLNIPYDELCMSFQPNTSTRSLILSPNVNSPVSLTTTEQNEGSIFKDLDDPLSDSPITESLLSPARKVQPDDL